MWRGAAPIFACMDSKANEFPRDDSKKWFRSLQILCALAATKELNTNTPPTQTQRIEMVILVFILAFWCQDDIHARNDCSHELIRMNGIWYLICIDDNIEWVHNDDNDDRTQLFYRYISRISIGIFLFLYLSNEWAIVLLNNIQNRQTVASNYNKNNKVYYSISWTFPQRCEDEIPGRCTEATSPSNCL